MITSFHPWDLIEYLPLAVLFSTTASTSVVEEQPWTGGMPPLGSGGWLLLEELWIPRSQKVPQEPGLDPRSPSVDGHLCAVHHGRRMTVSLGYHNITSVTEESVSDNRASAFTCGVLPLFRIMLFLAFLFPANFSATN